MIYMPTLSAAGAGEFAAVTGGGMSIAKKIGIFVMVFAVFVILVMVLMMFTPQPEGEAEARQSKISPEVMQFLQDLDQETETSDEPAFPEIPPNRAVIQAFNKRFLGMDLANRATPMKALGTFFLPPVNEGLVKTSDGLFLVYYQGKNQALFVDAKKRDEGKYWPFQYVTVAGENVYYLIAREKQSGRTLTTQHFLKADGSVEKARQQDAFDSLNYWSWRVLTDAEDLLL